MVICSPRCWVNPLLCPLKKECGQCLPRHPTAFPLETWKGYQFTFIFRRTWREHSVVGSYSWQLEVVALKHSQWTHGNPTLDLILSRQTSSMSDLNMMMGAMALILRFGYREIKCVLLLQDLSVTCWWQWRFVLVAPGSFQGNMSCVLEVSDPVPRSSQIVQGPRGHGAYKEVGTANGHQCSEDKEPFVYHLFLPTPAQHRFMVPYSGKCDHGVEGDEGWWHDHVKQSLHVLLEDEPSWVDMCSHLQ